MSDWTNRLKNVASAKVLVVGDLIMDRYVTGDIERISPEAPVPVLKVTGKDRFLAGGAANVSLNLAALGLEPVTVGIIGDDHKGKLLREQFRECGLESRGIVPFSNRITTEKTRLLARGKHLLRIDREITEPLSPAQEDELIARLKHEAEPSPAAIIISDYGKGVVTQLVLAEVMEISRKNNVPVFVDPHGDDFSRYAGAATITPNFYEACAAAGKTFDTEEELANEAMRLLETARLKSLLITRGPNGMSLFTAAGERYDVRTEAIEVYDVTGAGDTAIAAFAAGVIAGIPQPEAMEFANRAAAVSVMRVGAYAPKMTEIMGVGLGKIRRKDGLEELVASLRLLDKKIVFTNGCFDLLHVGHIKSLEASATFGDVLMVGLNSDDSVHRLKGAGRPVIKVDDRARVLTALRCVDYVVIFDEDTPRELIHLIKPDVLCKGGDYTRDEDVVGWDIVKEYGGKVVRPPLEKGFSTTNIVERIRAESKAHHEK